MDATTHVIVGVVTAVVVIYLDKKFFTLKSEKWYHQTENGHYNIHIKKKWTPYKPYLEVEIEDINRKKTFRKNFRKRQDWIALLDQDNIAELNSKVLEWYETKVGTA